jgi:hypothetical protein
LVQHTEGRPAFFPLRRNVFEGSKHLLRPSQRVRANLYAYWLEKSPWSFVKITMVFLLNHHGVLLESPW